LPFLYGVEGNYGISDRIDIGVNASYLYSIAMVGAQAKFNFYESHDQKYNFGFRMMVDYFFYNGDFLDEEEHDNSIHALMMMPAFIGGIRFGSENQHSFFYEVGAILASAKSESGSGCDLSKKLMYSQHN